MHEITLEHIGAKTRDAALLTKSTIDNITQINWQMNMLGLNARIEAARVGPLGAGFALVADEVRKVSGEIADIASGLGNQLTQRLTDLDKMVNDLSNASEGQRLVDLAFTAIDLIDRNLYERSCDVRWWATDADLVAAAMSPNPDLLSRASQRMGVILDAYTVYCDIWLCDMTGRILANGRPKRYDIAGSILEDSTIMGALQRDAGGEGFVAGDVRPWAQLGGRPTMAWASYIRENGAATGAPCGVIVTQFDWGPQADAVLASLRLGDLDIPMQAMLCTDRGQILAQRGMTKNIGKIPHKLDVAGWQVENGRMIGTHQTKGFETWRGKGWFGVVQQAVTTD
jgi:hypothetical protein